ncbi:hypothetical protein DRH27_00395 [Candidatus Falkowbacteria bacterium]|nr:MAG: hypothetical protein DRH27_00395 [Candidatus Falkowbacteria bacterium]
MRNIIKLRIFLWICLGLVITWFLWLAIVPSGVIIYKKDFTKDNYFIQKFTPSERAGEMTDGSQKIIGGPVYFSLRTPRGFDKALLTIKYKNENEFSIIEAGVLVDKTVWRYDLEPLENNIIDKMSMAWDIIRDGNVVFLQKEKKYESINNFMDDLPDLSTVAVYNYDIKVPYILKDYGKSDEEKTIETSLRGSYEFFTYIKNEELDFSFAIVDLNQNKDPDNVELFLYYGSERIDYAGLEDDGISEDNKQPSIERFLNIKTAGLPEGVYKVEIKASDDIITKKIITKQQKLSFVNNVWLYREGESNIDLYANSKKIQARTINPDSLQVIKAGKNSLALNETYKLLTADVIKASTTDKYTEISLEKDGVIISGEGVFSFLPESFINPKLAKVDKNLDIIGDNIQYVIADYNYPAENDDWKIAQAEFNLNAVYREKGAYSFIISLPGLNADDEVEDYVEVDEIEIKLIGKSLLEKIREIF